MASMALHGIMEKMASNDKDFRYMATSDMQAELQKDTFRADEVTERRLCRVVLQHLEDSSGDISSLANKCLGLLVHKLSVARLEETLDDLFTKMMTGKKEQQREIASLGLKTVLGEVSGGQLASVAVQKVTPKLIEGLGSKEPDVVNASLDLLLNTIIKFGNLMAAEFLRLKDRLLPLLDDNRLGTKKRAIQCLAALAPLLPADLLSNTNAHIFGKLRKAFGKPEVAQTYMHTMGAISRTVGWRFGRDLNEAVPLAMQHYEKAQESDDELREYCLQALEACVSRAPHDAAAHLEAIFPVALAALAFDPNYADDMDEDGEAMGDCEEDEEDGEDYSDDEDASWKVRRAAAKCVAAIVMQYPDKQAEVYARAAPELIQRFREREETVKTDVFHAFVDLLRQVGVAARRQQGEGGAGPLERLQTDTPAILRAAARQLHAKSLKTKEGAFKVLQELLAILPSASAADVDLLVPGVLAALSDRSSNSSELKTQALRFVRAAMASSPPEAWQPHLPSLAPPLWAAIGERYYRVTAEALRAAEQMVHVIRPSKGAALAPQSEALVAPLCQHAMSRMSAPDQDQEVKEAAIACAATAAATLGDYLQAQFPELLQALLERVRGESTRIASVKAFTQVATSPYAASMAPIVEQLLRELTSFLRKASRTLRQASLSGLDAVLAQRAGAASAGTLEAAVEEATALVSDADLAATALALHLGRTLLSAQAAAPALAAKMLPRAIALARSPLLQGAALEALQGFLVAVSTSPGGAPFDALLPQLMAGGNAPDTGKAAQHNIAQCVAMLCRAAGPAKVTSTVKSLLQQLAAAATPEPAKRMALLAIGSIGRSADLSSFKEVKDTLLAALASPSEEVKGAAALALGDVALGNLKAYLPFLLQHIQAQAASPKDQYLLLKALNEMIVSLAALDDGATQMEPKHQEEVLHLLLGSCEAEEECRACVAECLGHMALLYPQRVVPALADQARSPRSAPRAAVASAVRNAAVDRPHPVDAPLAAVLPGFLELLSDPDRHVRKAAVQMLSAVAHAKARLVAPHLGAALPRLYQQTAVDEALIRTVDLGPFKHKIDDGLELRKAAFECLDVLLDATPSRLDLALFIRHLESGLRDHYDVKMPCHLLLGKLAACASGHVLAALDRLIDPLEKTLSHKLKQDAVKQEVDRNEDMVRSCLRAVDALARMPNVASCTPWQAFMEHSVCAGPMAAKYAAVREERAEVEGALAASIHLS